MNKFLIRLTVVYTAIYFLYTYIMAWFGVCTFNDLYIILFEISLCVAMSTQGKYHCKYMRYTAYGITASDTLTRIDGGYDFLSEDQALIFPIFLIGCSISVSFFMALRHFYLVKKLKRKQDELHRTGTTKT